MTRSTKSGVKLPIQVGHAVYAITANPSSFVGAWQVVSSSREQPHWTTLLARAPRRECDSDCASSGDGHCQVDPAASAGDATDRSPRFVPDNSHVPSHNVSALSNASCSTAYQGQSSAEEKGQATQLVLGVFVNGFASSQKFRLLFYDNRRAVLAHFESPSC